MTQSHDETIPADFLKALMRGRGTMKANLWRLSSVLLLSLLASPWLAGSAEAACTEAPRPGVNWQRCNLNGIDFSGADLKGARLRDASFFRSNLEGTDFSGASAFRSKFVNAVLTGAKFEGTRLEGADFTKANLSDVSFKDADLRNTRLFRSILRGADLTGAKLRGANLNGADLSGATWVDGTRICSEGSIGRCN